MVGDGGPFDPNQEHFEEVVGDVIKNYFDNEDEEDMEEAHHLYEELGQFVQNEPSSIYRVGAHKKHLYPELIREKGLAWNGDPERPIPPEFLARKRAEGIIPFYTSFRDMRLYDPIEVRPTFSLQYFISNKTAT